MVIETRLRADEDKDRNCRREQDEFVARCGRVTELLAACLQAHGGSISAEHGIGLVKKPYLSSTRSEAEIAAMRGIKSVLDPNGVMNPGKLFDP